MITEAGTITEEQAERSPHSNLILQALGTHPELDVDLTYQELRRGDTVLVCSDGLSGQVLSTEDPPITVDNSPPGGTPGVILAFVDPRTAPDSEDGRRDWLAERLARYFGEKAREPIAYVECDWAEDGWTAGCVSPCGPGLLTSLGTALTAPCGRIHWAGTETSAIWNGYMDGAVRSGRRAAAEVIAARRHEPVASGALG